MVERMENLVKRDGRWFKKFTEIPFTGQIIEHHDNGQLKEKGNYRNSELEGEWITYYYNGQLRKKGKWKTRKEEGKWVGFNEDGTVNESMTGTFIYGKNISNFWNHFKGNFLK